MSVKVRLMMAKRFWHLIKYRASRKSAMRQVCREYGVHSSTVYRALRKSQIATRFSLSKNT